MVNSDTDFNPALDTLAEDTENNTIENTEDNSSNNEDYELINSLKQLNEELTDKLKRAVAETANVRTRYERMISEARESAISNFSSSLLPVLDNLNLSLSYNNDLTQLIQAIEMTKNELMGIFQKNGIQEIIPQPGDKFNYNFHNAIAEIVTNDYNNGTIVDVMKIGYKSKDDKLLRPAFVSVAKN